MTRTNAGTRHWNLEASSDLPRHCTALDLVSEHPGLPERCLFRRRVSLKQSVDNIQNQCDKYLMSKNISKSERQIEQEVKLTAPCGPVAQSLVHALNESLEQIWSASNNVRSCGGLNRKAKAVINRALRREGYKFYLLLEEDEQSGRLIGFWGLSRNPPVGSVTGYTLNQAAHKLGNGDASQGWKFYFGN